MTYFLREHTQKVYQEKGKSIDNTMNMLFLDTCKANETAMVMLLNLAHRIIKRRDSPFSSLKDAVLFSIQSLDCTQLLPLLKNGTKGVSHRLITEMIDAIHNLTLLG